MDLTSIRRRGWDRSHVPYAWYFSTHCNISSSRLLILMKSTWRNQWSVVPSSRPDEVDLTISSISSPRLFLPHEVDLTRSRILSSCLLVKSSRLNYIQYFVFLSSCPEEVDLTRSSILSSRLSFLMKSTWRDPVSCLLVLNKTSGLDEIESFAFSPRLFVFSSRLLVFFAPFLVFSSRLRFLVYLVCWGHF